MAKVFYRFTICGKIHDINKICKSKTTKKNTSANNFRKTNKWTERSKSIRKRDNYLCKICTIGKYGTTYKYTYKNLEVHHIIPIEEEYSKRLDSSNLIILCRKHHEMAEKGLISRKELKELIK